MCYSIIVIVNKGEMMTTANNKITTDPCGLCGHSIKDNAIPRVLDNGKTWTWDGGHNGWPRVDGTICDQCHEAGGGDRVNAIRRIVASAKA